MKDLLRQVEHEITLEQRMKFNNNVAKNLRPIYNAAIQMNTITHKPTPSDIANETGFTPNTIKKYCRRFSSLRELIYIREHFKTDPKQIIENGI